MPVSVWPAGAEHAPTDRGGTRGPVLSVVHWAAARADAAGLEADVSRIEGGVSEAELRAFDDDGGFAGVGVDAEPDGVRLRGGGGGVARVAVALGGGGVSGVQVEIESAEPVQNLGHIVEGRLVRVLRDAVVTHQGDSAHLACKKGHNHLSIFFSGVGVVGGGGGVAPRTTTTTTTTPVCSPIPQQKRFLRTDVIFNDLKEINILSF